MARAPASGLYALVAATAVSNLGNVVAVVALPWFVLETTGSVARTGLTAFATTLPLAAGAVVGGQVVDRVGARRSSILGDVGAGAAMAGIPAAFAAGVLEFWVLLALVFLTGTLEAPGRTARRALLPELADRAGVPLERANAVSTTAEHLGYVLGAPLAGVLVTTFGATQALWVDAATFAVSAVVVAAAVPAVDAVDTVEAGKRGFVDGARHVARTPLLRSFFVIWTVGAFLLAPLAPVVLPVYAREVLGGAGQLAAAITAYGVGGLLGTLSFGMAGRRLARRRFYVAVWVGYALLSVGLLLRPGLVGLVVVLLALGAVTGAYDPFEVTVQQELVPSSLRVGAFAVLLAVEMTVVPLAMLAYGLLMDVAGLRAGLVLFAIGNVLLAGYAVGSRPARSL